MCYYHNIGREKCALPLAGFSGSGVRGKSRGIDYFTCGTFR